MTAIPAVAQIDPSIETTKNGKLARQKGIRFQDLSLKGKSCSEQIKHDADKNAQQVTQIAYQTLEQQKQCSQNSNQFDIEIGQLSEELDKSSFSLDLSMPSSETLALAGAGAVAGALIAKEIAKTRIRTQNEMLNRVSSHQDLQNIQNQNNPNGPKRMAKGAVIGAGIALAAKVVGKAVVGVVGTVFNSSEAH